MPDRLQAALAKLPLVAILRGVTPLEAADIAEALLEEDFEFIEIPLNSPEPLNSIAAVRRMAPPRVYVGAGTVLTPAQVEAVAGAGGDLIVAPNTNVARVTENDLAMASQIACARRAESSSARTSG